MNLNVITDNFINGIYKNDQNNLLDPDNLTKISEIINQISTRTDIETIIQLLATKNNVHILKLICSNKNNIPNYQLILNKTLRDCLKQKPFTHHDVINYLIKEGADINRADGFLLRTAIEENNAPLVNRLLDFGANAELVNETTARLAIKNNNYSLVKLLVDNKVDFIGEQILEYRKMIENAYNNKHFNVLKYLASNHCVSYFDAFSKDLLCEANVDFLIFIEKQTKINKEYTQFGIMEMFHKNAYKLLYEILTRGHYKIEFVGISISNYVKDIENIKNIKNTVFKKCPNLLFNQIYKNDYKSDILIINKN